MRWNLRASLVALMAVTAAAIGLAVARWDARRGKDATGPAWSAARAITALPGQARGTGNEESSDRGEVTPVLSGPLERFRSADVLLLDSESPYLQLQREDLPGQPPRVPRPENSAWWGFDLWHYKFPSGDLILNPEVLDSIRPPE